MAQFEVAGRPQPSGLNTRTVDGGLLASFDGGRIGRATKSPPQFGQRPPSRLSTQSRQNVHSNEQIIASVADGGKSLSQHSQLGRSWSIRSLYPRHCILARSLIRREWTCKMRRIGRIYGNRSGRVGLRPCAGVYSSS
jgi:hypothetical protein